MSSVRGGTFRESCHRPWWNTDIFINNSFVLLFLQNTWVRSSDLRREKKDSSRLSFLMFLNFRYVESPRFFFKQILSQKGHLKRVIFVNIPFSFNTPSFPLVVWISICLFVDIKKFVNSTNLKILVRVHSKYGDNYNILPCVYYSMSHSRHWLEFACILRDLSRSGSKVGSRCRIGDILETFQQFGVWSQRGRHLCWYFYNR